MEGPATRLILRLFQDLPDPRARNRSHLLSDIVTIAILATMCGSEGWQDVAEWAEGNQDWLAEFLTLKAGVPSHDTFDDVFRQLDPAAFEACFQTWTDALSQGTRERGQTERFIAIDGKTLRHWFDHAWSKTPIHLVSALVAQNQLVPGQIKVDGKENEIVAIPRLLDLLNVNRCTVTIDAMGCQKEIAGKIREKKAHYVLALKENQPSLHEAARQTFQEAMAEKFIGWRHDRFESVEGGHGRIETRRVWMTNQTGHIAPAKDWTDLASIVMVQSTREMDDGHKSDETRYYITSHKKLDARRLADMVRCHWRIENQQHHVLDTTMNEDDCRIRKGHGPENFARLRRIALNQLRKAKKFKNGKERKISLRLKRKSCGWNRNFLLSALLA